ncbi:MAG: amino acid adenylation domain-containing protein, partial [Bacteroidota bacterium]
DKGEIKIETVKLENVAMEDLASSLMKPFDLSVFPLMRVSKVITDDASLPFLFVEFHHIIFDATSTSLFLQTFNEIYEGKTPQPPKFQYKDYAESFSKMRSEKAFERQIAFWKDKFSTEAPILELPTDFQRPSIKSDSGRAFEFSLDTNTTSALRALAQGFETTMFTVILCAFKVFLKRLSHQDDLVVGVPVAGRNHHELTNVFGMFVNTIPIRSMPDSDMSFIGYLNELKENVKGCFDNQDVQFEEIVTLSRQVRDSSRSPLFDVIFDMLNHKRYGSTANDFLDINEVTIDTAFAQKPVTSQYDLIIKTLELENNILFVFEYCTDLFRKETIVSFIQIFNRIIKSIVSNPTQKIGNIKIVSKEQQQSLLEQANNCHVAYPETETLHSLFEKQAAIRGNDIAVAEGLNTISYADLHSRSNRIAWLLREHGVKRGDLVGLLTGRGIETIVGMLGILKAGGAYLPIDIDYPDERIQYMVSDSGTQLLLTTAPPEKVAVYGISVLHLDEAKNVENKDSAIGSVNEPADLCYVIYTSGTTGKPKGVMVNHTNVVRLLFNDGFQYDFNATDVWPMFHSHCFDVSVWEMYGALLYGGKLVIVPKQVARDTRLFLELLKNQSVTILNQTPTAFYNLNRQEQLSADAALQLRYVIFAGEALSPASLKDWKEKYPDTRLVNMYGITETTVHSTYKEIGEQEIADNVSNIGKPLPTLSIYILDEKQKLVPNGIVGELYVGGAGVTMGYLGREDLTNERFIQNPYKPNERIYRSGDLARFNLSGELEYMGRIDHQVKIRGFRIELGEIAYHLSAHEQIKEAVVLAKEPEGEKFLVGYYVSSAEVSVSDLRTYLSQKLPDYMIPSHFVHLKNLPLTSNGKLDRRALPDPEYVRGNDFEAPSTDMERQLVGLWADILKLSEDQVSVTTSFFEMGGHSLNAIGLANMVHKAFNIELSLQTIFGIPTVRSMAEYLDTHMWLNEKAGDKTVKRTEIII